MKSIKFLTVLALFLVQSAFIEESGAIHLNKHHHEQDDDDEVVETNESKVESIAQTETESKA